MKEAEDAHFRFVFTWIVTQRGQKGWVTHYRPKHTPLSNEVESVFRLLGLNSFAECPEFEFDECYWRPTRYDEENFMWANYAHGWFDAHKDHFSPAVNGLLDVQSVYAPFGLSFLPKAATQDRPQRVVRPQPSRRAPPRPSPASKTGGYRYDVALSFAGAQRALAEQLATLIRDDGFEVFYDNFYPEQLWGKDLPVFFDNIYRRESRFCVIFVSKAYADGMWTQHERCSAVARMMNERGGEYILPIKIDDAELAGVAPTLGYLSIDNYPIDKIAAMLAEKLR
jgi:hypothetical protein